MEIFTRFNHNQIGDRQIDTLIGLAKGITADGKVSQTEAEFLLTWLTQNSFSDNPIILNLRSKVETVLEDGVLDRDEAEDLFSALNAIAGNVSDLSEPALSSTIPLSKPEPLVTFKDKIFLFTGTCAMGPRSACQQVVKERGGKVSKNVTKAVDYLVVGSYVTDQWAHETFGRKIEKAMYYRDQKGLPIAIISEAHWLTAAGL